MSQPTGRSAAFLEEMGIGAQWTLRRAAMLQLEPAPEYAEPAEVVEAAPAAVSDDAFSAALASAIAAPHDLADARAAAVTAAREVVPQPVVPVAASGQNATVDVAAPPTLEQSAAAVVDAPAPARPAAASMPPPSAEPSDPSDAADESMAWFDDAPAPARAAPVSEAAIATMDWPALKTAIATCTRCDLCATRRGVVPGRGAVDAQWMAIGAGPSRLDEKENRAVTGDAGQLLENMLKAIALTPERDVYITNLVKCRPSSGDGADRAPTPDEVAACRPYLERERALTGAAMLVTLGQAAAKGLLGAAARGKVLRHGGLPVVATYHPDDLLRRPEDKAKAWGDLCLARAARDGAA